MRVYSIIKTRRRKVFVAYCTQKQSIIWHRFITTWRDTYNNVLHDNLYNTAESFMLVRCANLWINGAL